MPILHNTSFKDNMIDGYKEVFFIKLCIYVCLYIMYNLSAIVNCFVSYYIRGEFDITALCPYVLVKTVCYLKNRNINNAIPSASVDMVYPTL